MTDEIFKPLIEGEIPRRGGPAGIFKILTYGNRVIRLPAGFVERPDHLHLARRLVVEHHRRYLKARYERSFPISYYKYLIWPDRSIRISVTGEVLGIFEDIPANPSFKVGGREDSLTGKVEE
jgi:hypothetical protein